MVPDIKGIESAWVQAYEEKGALWIHNGNPKNPHAELNSGKHSNGFFNSRVLIPDDELMRGAANNLVSHLDYQGCNIEVIDCVVGPQTGATKLAQFLSYEITQRCGHPYPCRWASPAKVEENSHKRMVFDDPEHTVRKGDVVLVCEDVLATGDSVELTEQEIHNMGGVTVPVIPFIVMLVNRSGTREVNGKRTIALIERHLPIWEPDKCPLCNEGSKAVRPEDNWTKLTTNH